MEYYSEEEVVKKPFLFISYSHGDYDIVLADTRQMYSMGVRLWWDKDMECGDNWKHRARDIILHPNCLGVLFYSSVSSYLSQPVEEERAWTLEAMRQKKSRGFFYVSINPDGLSTLQILRDTFCKIKEEGYDAEKYFPLYRVKQIAEVFASEIIFIARRSGKEVCETVYEKAKEVYATDDLSVVLKNLAKRGDAETTNGEYVYFFGKFCDKRTENPAFGNGLVSVADVIEYEGEFYFRSDLHWRVLNKNGDDVYMITEDIIAVRKGGDELNFWLQNYFTQTAFNDEERTMLKAPVRLACRADFNDDNKNLMKAKCTGAAHMAEVSWWIADKGAGAALQASVNDKGEVYKHGWRFRESEQGVRPVIKISLNDLVKKLNKQDI